MERIFDDPHTIHAHGMPFNGSNESELIRVVISVRHESNSILVNKLSRDKVNK